MKLQTKIAKTVHAFLQSQVQPIAGQVARMRAQLRKMAKSDLSQDEIDAIEQILAALDLTGFAILAGDVEDVLASMTADGGVSALAQIGLDVQANPAIMNIVSDDALAYARARSAEMVGMRRDELGRLVENPNAQWRIDESTREYLRGDVTTALQEGWSNDKLAEQLANAYGFSEDRAMVIARTETQMAGNAGALNGYKASGVVDGKQWITAEDDLVTPECAENGAAGPNGDGVLLDLDGVYPSGDDAPPSHPNCRCSVIPYIVWTQQPTVSAGQLEEA